MNNIALITCLDKNKKQLSSSFNNLSSTQNIFTFYYEYEALLCYSSWRKNAGLLKDIPIYALCNCINLLLKLTLNWLKKLNVILIPTENISIDYPLLNAIYSQYIFENSLYSKLYKHYIFLDLDAYIIKPLPLNFFQNKNIFIEYNLLAKLDYYKYIIKNNKRHKNISPELLYRYCNISMKMHGKCYNTMFIINVLENKLITKLFQYYLNNKLEVDDFFNKYAYCRNEKYFYEETIYDFMYLKNIINNVNSYCFLQELLFPKYFIHKHLTINNILNNIYFLKNLLSIDIKTFFK